VENQYIWEDNFEKHLLAAVKRGVKVRVMVPGGTKENAFLTPLNMETMHRLVQAGAEARVYVNPATPVSHLHAKHYSVDDNWVATGSCNADARSLVDHQELDVISTSPAFVQEVRTRLFEHDWAQASQPFVYKPATGVDKPFRGLLELLDYLF
jgi:phosphatidylserine/phosphatidylglycerophosphate/cardiolipin synthase-like enzyme